MLEKLLSIGSAWKFILFFSPTYSTLSWSTSPIHLQGRYCTWHKSTNKMKTLERRETNLTSRREGQKNSVERGNRGEKRHFSWNNDDIWLIPRGTVVISKQCILGICTSVFIFLRNATHISREYDATWCRKKGGKKVWLSCSFAKSLKWTLLNKYTKRNEGG